MPDKTVYEYGILLHFCLDVRIGELQALTWDDLDFSGEIPCVKIQHQIVYRKVNGKNRAMEDTGAYTKKNTEEGHRILPLPQLAIQVIDQLRKINGNKKYLLNSKGNWPISKYRYNEKLKRICITLGFKPKSSHKIRFYNISSLYDSELLSEKTIQQMSGHSNPGTARGYNKHIQNTNMKVAKDYLDSRFSNIKM